jgi:hypothetical protein
LFVASWLAASKTQMCTLASGFKDKAWCVGCADKETSEADGRELWLLAERYRVQGVKEWLMFKGIDEEGLLAATQYAL